MTIHPCPKCGTSIGATDARGELDAVCGTCRFGYRVVEGRVVERVRDGIVLRGVAAPAPAEGGRAPNVLVSFRLPGVADPLQVSVGDAVAVTYGIRGGGQQALLSIANLDTGEHVTLAEPGARSEAQAAALALLLVVITLAAMMGAGESGPMALLVGGLVGVGAWSGCRRWLDPRHRLQPADQARIAGWQRMLDTRREIDVRRAAIGREAAERDATRARLVALRNRMDAVGLASYARRIAAIDAAVALLDRQLAVDRALLQGYDRSIAIIEIEQEAGTALHALDSVTAAEIGEKGEELQALEREHEEMSRMIAANEEVELLLRGGRGASQDESADA